ncbi:MAG: TIGR02594 family protein [Aureispira sp.]|nr:TIGR02594 family protein [Aureispira sp.]
MQNIKTVVELYKLIQKWMAVYEKSDSTQKGEKADTYVQMKDILLGSKEVIKQSGLTKEDLKMDNYTRPDADEMLGDRKPNLNKLTGSVGFDSKKPDRYKNRKADVLAVQYYLNKHGYSCPIDGKADRKLSRQISFFCRSCQDPEVRGRAWISNKHTKTWQYLKGELQRPDALVLNNDPQADKDDGYYDVDKAELATNKTMSEKVGDHCANAKEDVKMVQQFLNKWGNYNLKENGRWPMAWGRDKKRKKIIVPAKVNPTRDALLDFQAQMGIKATGIGDADTWDYLTGKKDSKKEALDTTGGHGYGPKPAWIKVAEGEIGVKELVESGDNGERNNPRIIQYYAACGAKTSDEPAWCAAFTSWCLSRSGVSNPQDPGVAQWTGWGEKSDTPFYGSVGIIEGESRDKKTGKIKRKPWGHIGFIVGVEKGFVLMLGGNQDNSVSIKKFPTSKVTTFICPPGYIPPKEAYGLQTLEGDFKVATKTR